MTPPSSRWNRLTLLLIGMWCVGILTAFYLRFPLPVRLPLAVETLRDVAVAGGLAVLAIVVGHRLLGWLGASALLPEPPSRLLFSAGVGYGVLGLSGGLMAWLQLLRPLPLALAGAALLLLCRSDSGGLEDTLRRWWAQRGSAPQGAFRACLWTLLSVAMALMLLEALAPPTSYDALRYHLRLPALYAEAGGWVFVPYDFNAAFPANVDMLYAIVLGLGAPGAAKLTHLLLGWLAVGAVALLARRAAGRGAGLPAAAIFYTMPVVALNSAWAYVDMGVTLYTLLAVLCVWCWWKEGRNRWLLLGGILVGLALGTKYTGAVSIPVLGAAILVRPLWRGDVSLQRAMRGAFLLVLVACLVASPWLVRNWVQWGDPVYPFGAAWFGGDAGTYRAERHAAVLSRPEVPVEGPRDWIALPWRFAMDPWVRDEMVGPSLLVALPLLLLVGGGGTLGLIALALLYGVLWMILSPQVRLWIHGLGLFSVGAAASLLVVRRRGGALAAVASVVMIGAMTLSVGNLAVLQRGLSDPFPVVLGMESRERYLRRMLDGHDAMAFINRELAADARILFVGEIYGYYCQRDYLLGSKFDRAPIVDRIARSSDLDEFLNGLRSEGFTHVLYSMTQLRKLADLPGETLDWPDDRSRSIYRRFMVEHLDPIFESSDAVVARILLGAPEETPSP